MSSSYDLVFAPPVLDKVTTLTLTSTAGGRLDIEIVHPTQETLRFTHVKVSLVSGDYTNAWVVPIPEGVPHAVLTDVPGATAIYAEAWGADSWGNESVMSDEVTITTAANGASAGAYVPIMDGYGNVLVDSGTGAAIVGWINF